MLIKWKKWDSELFEYLGEIFSRQRKQLVKSSYGRGVLGISQDQQGTVWLEQSEREAK